MLEHRDDIVSATILAHIKIENNDTVFQFNVSNPAMNCIVHLILHVIWGICWWRDRKEF
jgi:hypothetical protein